MSSRARVLIGTLRRADPAVSRCATFEFEDLVQGIDDVDLADAGPAAWPRRAARAESLFPRVLRHLPGGIRPQRSDYELFFVSVHSAAELCRFQPLSRYLDAARHTACNVDEVWAHRLRDRSGEISILRRFDHLFTACQGAVDALSDATGRPCHYLPPGVDAERFCPYGRNLERVIDVYFMGRHRQALHDALRRAASETGRFYLFDTSGHSGLYDAAEHRDRLSELLGRTRYFVVDVAKADLMDHTGGQVEIGTRYFEGAAAGTVLIGVRPRTDAFDQLFGWPGAVVPIDDDPGKISAVLDDLDARPESVEQIRRRNVVESLRRHDGAYRWRAILEAVGLEPRPGLVAREERLELRAARIEREANAS